MGITIDYNRLKDPEINLTGMDFSLLVSEKPDAPSAIGGTGSTGELDMRVQVDADESGGADVQDLFKVETVPLIAADGAMSLKTTITPINGDGTEGTPQILTVVHNENMDAWQTAAGRARQA